MDRFVIREPRLSTGNPQPSHIALPSTSTDGYMTLLESENTNYGGYGQMFANAQRLNNPGIIVQNPGQIASGIDPRYLAAYGRDSCNVTGQQEHIQAQQNVQEQQNIHVQHIPRDQNIFGQDNVQGHLIQGHQNIHGQQTNQAQQIQGQYIQGQQYIQKQQYTQGQQYIQKQQYTQGQQYIQNQQYIPAQQNIQTLQNFQGQQQFRNDHNLQNITPEPIDAIVYTKYKDKKFVGVDKPTMEHLNIIPYKSKEKPQAQFQTKQSSVYGHASTSTTNEVDAFPKTVAMPLKEQTNKKLDFVVAKNESQNRCKSRIDNLKALHKSGPRAFSGTVDKVLKWHKALQDVGVLIFYEIVAKCLSVTRVKSYDKILVIRDENGPAMQVVYYEIDFLLPELVLPCTVRVVGRMLVGTCRLQAFSVRMATGDDVATLPRRAAVAQHHVAKLCKEYIP